MKSINSFLLILIISYTIYQSVQSQDQSEFISLSCGFIATADTIFTEPTTNITYRSDEDYIDTGVTGKINEAYRPNLQQQTWSLRSFPTGERNCYNLNISANRKYLIRGTFVYGNYDGLSHLPRFDLYIGPNKWESVQLEEENDAFICEIIHVPKRDYLQVCLVKTGKTTPFISSLEIRPLNFDDYVSQSGSLKVFSRNYFSQSYIRYPNDVHDRIWTPYSDKNTKVLSTSLPVDTSNSSYNIPQLVAKSALVPANATQPLELYWRLEDFNSPIYIYMHFAEIQNLEANEIREFNITYNGGKHWLSFFRPQNFKITSIFNLVPVSSPDGFFKFDFTMTGNSTLPPLINAIEVYSVVDTSVLETNQDEVYAMNNMKKIYGLTSKESWQGDPCSPQLYKWNGVDCNYQASDHQLLITSLNLSATGLGGTITPEISKLTNLTILDLSQNDLSGEIPSFLADMKMLKLIDLHGNPKLNLSIPDSLKERIKNNSLTLITHESDDETYVSNPKKRSIRVHVITMSVLLAGLIILIAACGIALVTTTRRNHKASEVSGSISVKPTPPNPSFGLKERRFTYSEVLKMTNNFERVLGEGGYGRVYLGNLDDTKVAVKVLSSSSTQGYKHFKAEVELLLRVHHRHLVGLVGYCDDGDSMGLVYEYMINGDLREHMSGLRGESVLTWEQRMQIALEAAQGLEYLHNGCRPPIIHRDVKTTNILLNELFQAKLSDFGLSRSFPIDGESTVVTVVAGTPGYLDPEYYRTNLLSEKSDVYSFGVVLLEIITNKPVIDTTHERPHITQWVGLMITKGDIKNMVDPKLNDDYDVNGVWKVLELALACVNPFSNSRPTMPYVVTVLNECLRSEIAKKQGSRDFSANDSIEYRMSLSSELGPSAR